MNTGPEDNTEKFSKKHLRVSVEVRAGVVAACSISRSPSSFTIEIEVNAADQARLSAVACDRVVRSIILFQSIPINPRR